MRSPSRSGAPAASVVTRATSLATRPIISWPMMVGPLRGVRPCQPCRSEPQMLATLMRTSRPSGSTSGNGNSRASKGWPAPVKRYARPFMGPSSGSEASHAPQTLGDAGLEAVAVHVQERHLAQHPAAAPAARPELGEPVLTGGDDALGGHEGADSPAVHRSVEVRRAQLADHLARARRDGVPVAAQ